MSFGFDISLTKYQSMVGHGCQLAALRSCKRAKEIELSLTALSRDGPVPSQEAGQQPEHCGGSVAGLQAGQIHQHISLCRC